MGDGCGVVPSQMFCLRLVPLVEVISLTVVTRRYSLHWFNRMSSIFVGASNRKSSMMHELPWRQRVLMGSDVSITTITFVEEDDEGLEPSLSCM